MGVISGQIVLIQFIYKFVVWKTWDEEQETAKLFGDRFNIAGHGLNTGWFSSICPR